MSAIINQLGNGLTVILEPVSSVQSVAYNLSLPGGIVNDEPGMVGASLILIELMGRGAGGMDSVALSNAFDSLGVRHSESADMESANFRGSLVGENLGAALSLVSKILSEPMLPEKEVENIQSLLLQDLESLEDNPARKVMVELGSRYHPAPFNRSSFGDKNGIAAVTLSSLKDRWSKAIRPSKAILSIAGNIDAKKCLAEVQQYFGNWNGGGLDRLVPGPSNVGIRHHIQTEAAQLQICFAFPSAHFGHPMYYTAKVATQLLSGGMFGRLFIEVREKRGLVYSVYASHSSDAHKGTTIAYGGTTPERAQETLDVMLDTFRGINGTITDQELSRAKANLKAALVMSQESTSARASSNGSDYWISGRIRPLEEIKAAIDKVTVQDIYEYNETFPVDRFSLVSLGAKELKTA